MKRIFPLGFDPRFKVFQMDKKDPLGFGDVQIKCELFDGSYIYQWIDPDILKRNK